MAGDARYEGLGPFGFVAFELTHERALLLRHPRVHFHYTPTHASWMNMIECFFSILTRQALTQSVQRSKKDLKDFLIRYLNKYSENPTPFTWTKGPDQLQRIIETTKQYQAAHPKQPKQRKADFVNPVWPTSMH